MDGKYTGVGSVGWLGVGVVVVGGGGVGEIGEGREGFLETHNCDTNSNTRFSRR